MRALALTFAACAIAGPGLAQTAAETRAEANRIVAESIALGGFAEDVTATMTECYTSRMTDAEAAALVAAEGDATALQAVTSTMEAQDEVFLCIAEALE